MTSNKNPIVDVDPFGPPLLASSKQQNAGIAKSTKLAITAPIGTNKESLKKEKEETSQEHKANKSPAQTAKQAKVHEQTQSERRQSSKESDEEAPRRPKTALHHNGKSSTKHKVHHKKSLSRSPKKVTIDENVQVNPAHVEQKMTSSVDELHDDKNNSSRLSLNKMSDSRFDEQFEQMFPDLASSQTDMRMQRESSTNSLTKQQQSTSNLFELTKSDQYFDDDFDDENDDILNVLK